MNAAAERFFVDTNVLLYSVDPADGGKRELARRWADIQGVRTTVETLAQWQPTGFGLGVWFSAPGTGQTRPECITGTA